MGVAKDRVVVSIAKCPRCGGDHDRLPLRAFDPKPASGPEWFGQCPSSHQPITANVKLVVEAF
jgi:hypothetical protein